ncbi:MAG: hypothetical protein CL675_13075 [Bdellovibrionaceae bacterium]|nr:hypothetical protein [Pseudobdellovibrionaceae bacterium]
MKSRTVIATILVMFSFQMTAWSNESNLDFNSMIEGSMESQKDLQRDIQAITDAQPKTAERSRVEQFIQLEVDVEDARSVAEQ